MTFLSEIINDLTTVFATYGDLPVKRALDSKEDQVADLIGIEVKLDKKKEPDHLLLF